MATLEMKQISGILGGKKTLHWEIENAFDFIELGSRGVPKRALIHLVDYLCISMGQAAQLLSVSERTIQRYSAEEHFNRTMSEQILQLAKVAARGVEVFEDKARFLAWLNQPSIALANETPIGLLQSRFGAQMVLDELGRMEHGVFA
ncbi:MAG: DUF2384 domain-containing protein [bacterium]|nr:DUF2384 domain-containing protein [bacterium]